MSATESVKVWDPLVRIFHWALVIGFTVAYLTGEDESALHIWSGYIVGGLIAFRLVWGLVGTRHARFRDFLYGPRKLLGYTRSLLSGHPQRYLGHNPLGGLMVVLLLLALVGTTITGLQVYAVEEGKGPLAPLMASGPQAMLPIAAAKANGDEHEEGHEGEREELYEELHELFANLTLALVILHVLGVISGSLLHRENLIRAMFTGRKPARLE